MTSKREREVRKRFRLGREVDTTLLKNLITLIDGYRVNYLGDPKPFDKPIRAGKLGREISAEWKKIQRSLMRIATTVKTIPRLGRLLVIQSMLRSMSIAVSSGALLLPLTGASPIIPENPFLLIFALLLIAAVMLVLSKLAGRKVDREIEAYFDEHRHKYKFVRRYLRQTTQRLIYTLSHHLKASRKDPSDHTMKLYRTDYDGIRVLKKPGWFRKRYVVEIKLSD